MGTANTGGDPLEDTATSAGSKPRAPWTLEDGATLWRLAGEGHSDCEIAAHLNRDVKLIGRKRRELNVDRGVALSWTGTYAKLCDLPDVVTH